MDSNPAGPARQMSPVSRPIAPAVSVGSVMHVRNERRLVNCLEPHKRTRRLLFVIGTRNLGRE
jgi:hypothetical protein